jgi:hypothetical protein
MTQILNRGSRFIFLLRVRDFESLVERVLRPEVRFLVLVPVRVNSGRRSHRSIS